MISHEPPIFRHTFIASARVHANRVHSLIVAPQPYCIKIAQNRTTFRSLDFAPSIWPYIYVFLDNSLLKSTWGGVSLWGKLAVPAHSPVSILKVEAGKPSSLTRLARVKGCQA